MGVIGSPPSRIVARLNAASEIVRRVATEPGASWGDQMSGLAAVGHVFCNRHTMWKLPHGHPDPETIPDGAALDRRLRIVEAVSSLLAQLEPRDRDDVVDAAGMILFDSVWRAEDYDALEHAEGTPPTPKDTSP